MGVRECPVDEVSPGGDELVVVAAHEIRPRKVAVLRLGARDDEKEAQSVGVVPAEDVTDVDDDVSTRAELPAFHGEVLAGDDVVGEDEIAAAAPEFAAGPVAEEDARPDHGVERDIVLAHEVVVTRIRVLPPLAPRIRIPGARGPLDACREVADDGVEPDVDALSVLLVVSGNRNSYAPVEITRDWTRFEIVHEVQREAADVRAPIVLTRDPFPKPIRERRQVEKEVVRLAEHRRLPVDLRPRVLQVDRVELPSAVVALVAAGALETAVGARAFDVPIRQRVPGGLGERNLHRSLDDEALVVKRPEQVADDRVVSPRRGAREEVVRETEIAKVLADNAVVVIGR